MDDKPDTGAREGDAVGSPETGTGEIRAASPPPIAVKPALRLQTQPPIPPIRIPAIPGPPKAAGQLLADLKSLKPPVAQPWSDDDLAEATSSSAPPEPPPTDPVPEPPPEAPAVIEVRTTFPGMGIADPVVKQPGLAMLDDELVGSVAEQLEPEPAHAEPAHALAAELLPEPPTVTAPYPAPIPRPPIIAAPAQPLHDGDSGAISAPPQFVTEETPIPTPLDVPAAPRRLGNFEILRTLGSGGMADVFLARRVGLMGFEKLVALKVIHPHLTHEQHFVTMFFDEARLAAKIHDPRVVQIQELGESNGTYFIAMEYLAGESLSALIKKGLRGGPVMPPHLAARVVADVAGGLHAAHELRDETGQWLEVVHRDVSHGNVIVLYSGGVKVLDFGVAKARSSLTQTVAGERKGKYGYMSPEQVRGEPLDRRSDIFSLGVVLWETLTRKRLFAADNEPATMKRVLEGDPPPPSAIAPAVSPALDRIVLRALAKEARDRYQTAEEMCVALEAYLQQAGVASGHTEVSAHMRAAFADRIESKARRVTHEGEPIPLADLRTPEAELTPTQMRARSRRRTIALAAVLPIVVVGAFLIGRRGNSDTPAVAPTKDVAIATPAATGSADKPVVAAPDKSLVESKLDSADIAIQNGRIASPPGDNALELIIDVEMVDPANPRAKELRKHAIDKLLADAQVLWDAGKQDSARSIYEDVLLFDPGSSIALERRKSKEVRAVPKTIAEVAIANPDEIPWLVSQIDLAIIERRLVEPPGHNALEYLERLRKIDPHNSAGTRLGGEVANALSAEAGAKPEKKDELLAAAKTARGTPEKPAGAGSGSGSAATTEHKEKAADAKLAAEWISKGNAQLAGGHLADARSAFEKAIVADPNAHGALAGLAEVAYNESDYTRAVLAAKRAVLLAPNVLLYRMSLAKSYYKLLRYDDAIKQWQKVIQLDAKSPFAGSAQKNIEMAQRKMGGG